MTKLFPLLTIILICTACNGGGGGGGGGGEAPTENTQATPFSIELLSPASFPTLISTPTIKIFGTTADTNIKVYSDSSCSTEVGSGAALSDNIELTLSALPVGETNLHVKDENTSCSPALFTYRYGYKLSGVLTYDFVPVSEGYANYMGTTQKPMRNVFLELRRASDDSVLDSSSTNDSGSYQFFLTSNENVYVAVWAEIKNPSVVIEDNTNSNATYVAMSSNYNITGDVIANLNAPSGWQGTNSTGSYAGGRFAAPFAILDSVYSAITKIKKARPDASFPQLKINWSVNNVAVSGDKTIGQIGTSHFSPTDKELYILGKADSDTDEYDRHIIVHEWGHYFENQLSRSDSTGGQHGFGDIKDMTLAFGEGWGNALSAMVFDPDIRYVDTGGSKQQTTYNSFSLESSTDTNKGWFSETSIQEILFDIYDSNNETGDSLSLGIGPIYDVMVGHQKNTSAQTSIFSFINGLKKISPSNSSKIDLLLVFKNISSISDDFGSSETNFMGWDQMSSVYENLAVDGPSLSTTLWGSGKILNDMMNSRYIRFTATSSSTRLVYSGDDSFIINIYQKGTPIVVGFNDNVGYICTDGEASENLAHTFSTVPGQEYVIRIFTDDSFIYWDDYYVNVQTQLQSL